MTRVFGVIFMNPTVIRVSALFLALISLVGLLSAWLATAVAMGFGDIFQIPLIICVALLSASPLLMNRAPRAQAWSISITALRWLGVVPFLLGLYFAMQGFVQIVVIEGKVVHGLWSGIALIVICISSLMWPELKFLAGRFRSA